MKIKKSKNPILEYEALPSSPVKDLIVPAKTLIPDWYKKIPKTEMLEEPNVKLCVPFLESFMNGYMITLPYDLYIKNDNGYPSLTWPSQVQHTPQLRNNFANENIVPTGHYPQEFVWKTNVSWTVPKGYSVLVTNPLNRHDLPFTTLSAIIDGGLVVSPISNIPFYIKSNFEGLVPQGTPIAQLIPFRQEKWKSKKTDKLVDIGILHNNLAISVFRGWYKKTFWQRKEYS